MAKFRKLITAVLVPVAVYVADYLGLSFGEEAATAFVSAVLTALGVYVVPNDPQ